MQYYTSITRKGQMTLPKEVREALGIYNPQRLLLDFDEKRKVVSIKKIRPITDFAGIISKERHKKAMRKHGLKNVEDIRGWMEKNYERI